MLFRSLSDALKHGFHIVLAITADAHQDDLPGFDVGGMCVCHVRLLFCWILDSFGFSAAGFLFGFSAAIFLLDHAQYNPLRTACSILATVRHARIVRDPICGAAGR